MCNAQSLEYYVWSELTTSLFKGLDTDLCWVIIQCLIFQDWHHWYFWILISGLILFLDFQFDSSSAVLEASAAASHLGCAALILSALHNIATSFLGKLIYLDLHFPLLEGDRRLFELKTKAQIAIWNLNRAGSVPSESQLSLLYPVLLLLTTLGGTFCWWGGKFLFVGGLQSL